MRPGEKVVLLGRELEREEHTGVWRYERDDDAVVYRLHRLREHETEPLWAAYVLLVDRADARGLHVAELAKGVGGTAESAIALCEQDARERSAALLSLLQPGADWLRADEVDALRMDTPDMDDVEDEHVLDHEVAP